MLGSARRRAGAAGERPSARLASSAPPPSAVPARGLRRRRGAAADGRALASSGYRLLQRVLRASRSASCSSSSAACAPALRALHEHRARDRRPARRDDADARELVDADNFALYCTPAINLFPKRARPHPPDATRATSTTSCRPHPADGLRGLRRRPGHRLRRRARDRAGVPAVLRVAATARDRGRRRLLHGAPRAARCCRRSQQRHGPRSSYVGSEVFLSLVDADDAPYRRATCSQLAVPTLVHQPRPAAAHAARARRRPTSRSTRRRRSQSVRCLGAARRGPLPTPVAEGDVGWRLHQPPVAQLPVAGRHRPAGAAPPRCASCCCSTRRRGRPACARRSRACARCARGRSRGACPARPDHLRARPRDHPDVRRAAPSRATARSCSARCSNEFFATLRLDQLASPRRSLALAGAARSCDGRRDAGTRPVAVDAQSRARSSDEPLGVRLLPGAAAARGAHPERRASASVARAARRAGAPRPGAVARLRAVDARRRSSRRPRRAPPRLAVTLLRPARAQRPAAAAPDRVRARPRCATTATRRFARFLDMFHHRHAARCSTAPGRRPSRRSASTGRDDDRFGVYVGRAVRPRRAGAARRDAMPDLAKLLLRRAARRARRATPRASQTIARRLSSACRSRVEQFVGALAASCPHEQRSRLGGATRRRALGSRRRRSASTVWDCQHRFRAACSGRCRSPTTSASCPGGRALRALRDLRAQLRRRRARLGRAAWSCDGSEVPPLRSSADRPARLGWTHLARRRRRARNAGPRTTLHVLASRPATGSAENGQHFEGSDHGRDQPRRAVRQAQPARLQGDRERDRVLQAARQPVRRAGALDAPDPAAARTRDLHRIVAALRARPGAAGRAT